MGCWWTSESLIFVYRYNIENLFVSSGKPGSDQLSSGTIFQISRLQSTNLNIDYNRENLEYLDETVNQIQIDRPIINLSFDYISTNGNNERNIGLVTNGFSSVFYKLNETKNFYLVKGQANSAEDLNFDTGSLQRQCFAIGNAYINNYSVSASVNDFVKCTFGIEGQNLIFYSGISGVEDPGVNIQNGSQLTGLINIPLGTDQFPEFSLNSANDVSALSYKDIIMEFPQDSVFALFMSGANACHLQSFNLSFNIPRTDIKSLGDQYPYKPMDFPIEFELSAEAFVERYREESLRQIECIDTGHNINIYIKQPCSDFLAVEYYLKGMKLVSQEINSSIGQNASVSWRWKGVVPGNLRQSGSNFFMVANGGTEAYEVDSYHDIDGVDQFGNPLFLQEIVWKRILNENFFSANDL